MALNVTESSFEKDVVNSDKPVLIDFWAPWCGPCRNIAPILDEISSEETDFYVGKINVDENQQLAMKFRIQSIPALMVMKNGEVVASRVGGGSKQDLLSWVKSNI
jgi:thioredoxin 1